MKYGLAIGADTSQGAPGDALEYSAAAGAAAFIMGAEKLVATLDVPYSFMTDTPDFWRREYSTTRGTPGASPASRRTSSTRSARRRCSGEERA